MTKQFTKVRAIFNPAKEHIHTLRPELKKYIGREYIFKYVWIYEDDEIFPGVWALQAFPYDNLDSENFFQHVPEFDLEIIEQVR